MPFLLVKLCRCSFIPSSYLQYVFLSFSASLVVSIGTWCSFYAFDNSYLVLVLWLYLNMRIHLPHYLPYMLGRMNTWFDSKLLHAWSWDQCFDIPLDKLSSRGEPRSFSWSWCLLCFTSVSYVCNVEYELPCFYQMIMIGEFFKGCMNAIIGWCELDIRVFLNGVLGSPSHKFHQLMIYAWRHLDNFIFFHFFMFPCKLFLWIYKHEFLSLQLKCFHLRLVRICVLVETW